MSELPSRPRLLLRRLHRVMAGPGTAQARLNQVVRVIAQNMVAEVCSVYLARAGNILELFATEGLNPEAVHRTRLRFGEGLVGLVAQYAQPLNLAEARDNPHFVYKEETGEEAFHSLMGVPIVRNARVTGVLVVQNVARRVYTEEEVEAMQTVAMVLAELVGSSDLIGPEELTDDEAAPLGVPVTLDGLSLSPGIAVGHAVFHRPRVQVTRLLADDVDAESARLDAAFGQLRDDFDRMMNMPDLSHVSQTQRDILETYRLFAADEGWQRRIQAAIDSGLSAEAAVERVQQQNSSRLSRTTDPYLRERLSDLDDLSMRLIRILVGRTGTAAAEDLPEDAILVARHLGPAELLDYDRSRLNGVILEEGAPTAHLSIVARGLGLPVLGRVTAALDHIRAGGLVILDAQSGHAYLNATDEIVESYQKSISLLRQKQAAYAAERDVPAQTRDGTDVSLMINAGLVVDLPHLEASGAAGIGLFRTEFQFMVGSEIPKLSVQRDLYAQVLDAAQGKPVVFRTLDIGGDKPVAFLPRWEEENPAMGWRAIRIALDRPALLRQQLRALLMAAEGRSVSIMFPMVADVAEFRQARALVDKEKAWLTARNYRLPDSVEIGVMLEVPALLWDLDALLTDVDFISVGTNDFFQFFFACDRGNPRLTGRYDSLAPASLRVLGQVIAACDRHGVALSVCGEMASKPLEAMALLGLGLRCLSVAPTAVGPIKAMVRSLDLSALSDFIKAQLSMAAGGSLRSTLRAYARDHNIDLPDF